MTIPDTGAAPVTPAPRAGEEAGKAAKVVHPHDKLFRKIFTAEPVNAASELRAVLPAEVLEIFDVDQLRQASGSFVDDELRKSHTDALFTGPLREGDGEAILYLLFEHQSTVDALMAFRLLGYLVSIWADWLGRNPTAKRLPAIIPVVLSHDQSVWTAPVEMLDLIDLGPRHLDAVRDYLPQFRFILDDLAKVDHRALQERALLPIVRVTLTLFRIHRDHPDPGAELTALTDDLRAVRARPNGRAHFRALLTYIHEVWDIPFSHLHTLAATIGPEAEEDLMTTAERLRIEGRTEGRAQGLAEGRTEMLVKLLTAKFGEVPPATLMTVHGASGDQLETWTLRVLTAQTLDEVFAPAS